MDLNVCCVTGGIGLHCGLATAPEVTGGQALHTNKLEQQGSQDLTGRQIPGPTHAPTLLPPLMRGAPDAIQTHAQQKSDLNSK